MTEAITSRHLIEVHRLNYSLGRFICAGLTDIAQRPEASIDILLAAVAMHSMDQLDSLARFNRKPLRSKKEGESKTTEAELAYMLYAKFVSSHHLDVVAEHPPAIVGELPDSRQQAIVDSLNRTYADLPTIPAPDDVQRAWLQACRNSHRTYQRVGALYYLASQLPKHPGNTHSDAVNSEIEKAAKMLFRSSAAFEATEMRFAILLQGEALAYTKAKILAKSFGPGTSVMHYLQDNECMPGRYLVEAENKLRATIAQYAAAS